MLHVVEATIDKDGHTQWCEQVQLKRPQRVLITLLGASEDEPLPLSELALSDWLNEDEETAWAHLQPEESSRLDSHSRIYLMNYWTPKNLTQSSPGFTKA